jgi:hypothetical protein
MVTSAMADDGFARAIAPAHTRSTSPPGPLSRAAHQVTAYAAFAIRGLGYLAAYQAAENAA